MDEDDDAEDDDDCLVELNVDDIFFSSLEDEDEDEDDLLELEDAFLSSSSSVLSPGLHWLYQSLS